MNNVVLIAGLACLIAAIVGGGLKAFGIEVPVLESRLRQVILGVVGIILIFIGKPPQFNRPIPHDSPHDQPEVGPAKPEVRPGPPSESAPAQKTQQISVTANDSPRVVAPGGSTQITVMATAGDTPVPGARVWVRAGGGVFQDTGATESTGVTDERGLFHTVWATYEASVYTGDMSYSISVSVNKDGFLMGNTSIQIPIKK